MLFVVYSGVNCILRKWAKQQRKKVLLERKDQGPRTKMTQRKHLVYEKNWRLKLKLERRNQRHISHLHFHEQDSLIIHLVRVILMLTPINFFNNKTCLHAACSGQSGWACIRKGLVCCVCTINKVNMAFLSHCRPNHKNFLPLHFITASLLTMIHSMKTNQCKSTLYLTANLPSLLLKKLRWVLEILCGTFQRCSRVRL